MKVQSLRWPLLSYLILLLSVIAINSTSDELGVGVSMNWTSDDYSFSAGAPPWVVAFAFVGICLCVLLYRCQIPVPTEPMPHLIRRYLAGLADWAIALMLAASVVGLLNVLVEYAQTGNLEWVIDRQEHRPWDALRAFGGVLSMFAVMPLFVAVPMATGRPTPGACIFGYCVRPDTGSRLTLWSAFLRALLGAFALFAWPCWIMAYFFKREKNLGKFWLDAVFETHAEFLK
ncbi:RDD family protein [Occallatibacter savannae]|uniref:RDD family protein n=1 Tax=Occallatibacter savannae TaxID=1002691 RepID=UPI0013A5B3C8|nr:RDD family protein [Occallatibacter savannae]